MDATKGALRRQFVAIILVKEPIAGFRCVDQAGLAAENVGVEGHLLGVLRIRLRRQGPGAAARLGAGRNGAGFHLQLGDPAATLEVAEAQEWQMQSGVRPFQTLLAGYLVGTSKCLPNARNGVQGDGLEQVPTRALLAVGAHRNKHRVDNRR